MVTVTPGVPGTVTPGVPGGEAAGEAGTPIPINTTELPSAVEPPDVLGKTPEVETLVDTNGAVAADAAAAESARVDLSGLAVDEPVAEGSVADTAPPAGQVGTQEVGNSLNGAPGAPGRLERVLNPDPAAPVVEAAHVIEPAPIVEPPVAPALAADITPAPVAPIVEPALIVDPPVSPTPAAAESMPLPLEVDGSSTNYDATTEETPAPPVPPVEPALYTPPVAPAGEPLGAETVKGGSAVSEAGESDQSDLAMAKLEARTEPQPGDSETLRVARERLGGWLDEWKSKEAELRNPSLNINRRTFLEGQLPEIIAEVQRRASGIDFLEGSQVESKQGEQG